MTTARPVRRGETYERSLRQERLILDVTELLAGALEDTGVTRAELARRLDRTPGFVSQVLGGGRNLTLRTIADIAAALSLQPYFGLSHDPNPCRSGTVEGVRADQRRVQRVPPETPKSKGKQTW